MYQEGSGGFWKKMLGTVFLLQRFGVVNPWTCIETHAKAFNWINCSFRPQFLKKRTRWPQIFFSCLELTRWVPYDGYIRHQNDHLSGRMTDISVMSEWQVAGVGGTRPLENVLGEALKGRFSFEARNYLFSFQSYVRFEEFFVSRAFERFGAKLSSSGAFGFDDVLEVFLKTPLRHRAFFCKLRLHGLRPQVFFWKFLFSKTEPMLLAWQLWRSPSWAKHFGDGTSKTRMKTWLPCVGETERRRTMDRRRDWRVVCGDPWSKREKKRQGSQRVIVRRLNLHHLQTSEFWGACFQDPMSLPFRTSLFSWTLMYSCRTVKLQRGESEEKQSSVTFPVLITEA